MSDQLITLGFVKILAPPRAGPGSGPRDGFVQVQPLPVTAAAPDFVEPWKARNQSWPSIPSKGKFHLTALRRLRTLFQPGMAAR